MNAQLSPAEGINPTMFVTKRNGTLEPVLLEKIVKAIERHAHGLQHVEPMRIAQKTIAGLYDNAPTSEIDKISIRTAAAMTSEEPQYSLLAGRLQSEYIRKELKGQGITTFSDSIEASNKAGLLNARTYEAVQKFGGVLDAAIRDDRTGQLEYFGIKTVYDRYLLKEPVTRKVLESIQHFMMRVAIGLYPDDVDGALELYNSYSSMDYFSSSPTLFNAGTKHQQLSSCYLLDSPEDSLEAIYTKYADVAKLSKFAGGIGVSFSRVRSRGSYIRGTNGHSNGLVPWLKTLDASVAAVNQGGKRKGAACVYLETWHADILEFLELRNNTGDHERRTHNLNLANWIPDEFMRRVESDGTWSLMDPSKVPHLVDLHGSAFDEAYCQAEQDGLVVNTIKARDLYTAMLKTLAETGNGWMTFKDRANGSSNQTLNPKNVIHLSNLCTEVLEVTSADESAVCNLGSINLGNHVKIEDGVASFDFEKLAATTKVAIRQLNQVPDINFYPIDSTKESNMKWRPVGLGVMGLQDVFFKLGWTFDSQEAEALTAKIAEYIYFYALETSVKLAKALGPHAGFDETRASQGELSFDYFETLTAKNRRTIDADKWEHLRHQVKAYGLRNSLMIAIAPTATIASILGAYECIEPQVSNLFKRETLSGDFLVVNKYLTEELRKLGLWTPQIRDQIKLNEGSIQSIEIIPERLREIYRTVWEIPQRRLLDMAAARQPFIDQGQSTNLFMESPKIGQLSSMYMYAWKAGLKTTYYLRSRPATKIAKTTVSAIAAAAPPVSDQAAVFCSLENPELCEACQ